MRHYFAQCIKIAGEEICGPLPTSASAGGCDKFTVACFVNKLIGFIFPISGILLFFFLVWGGFTLLTSAGNPEKLKSAQGKMTAAIIGFILLVSSYLIVKLVAKIFGLTGVL
jgi:hypothetical protein